LLASFAAGAKFDEEALGAGFGLTGRVLLAAGGGAAGRSFSVEALFGTPEFVGVTGAGCTAFSDDSAGSDTDGAEAAGLGTAS
jgi:hypothetical protein